MALTMFAVAPLPRPAAQEAQWDHAAVHPGDSLIYRRREDAPSERVLFVSLQDRKQKPRLEVEFTAGDAAGTREWVPQNRIYGAWAEVEAADAERDGLVRLRADDDLTDVETTAIVDVYDLLVPLATCEWEWNPVRWSSRVRDQAALEEALGAPLGDVLGESATMRHDGALLVSPNGSSKFTQALCRAHSEQVVAWVLEQEERRRIWSKTGKPAGVDGERRGTSARWEWEMYRSTYRPLYELLRSWCGHRAVTAHERRVAAEAEVRRLELLVHECLEAIRKGHVMWADTLEDRLERERITPETIRPLVERPLDPSEVQVRVEHRNTRRWSS